MGITLPHFKRYIRDKVNSHNSNWTHHHEFRFSKTHSNSNSVLWKKLLECLKNTPEIPWATMIFHDFPWSFLVSISVCFPSRIYPSAREDQDESWREVSSSRTCNFDAGGDTAIFRRIFGPPNWWMTKMMMGMDVICDVFVCVWRYVFWWGSNGRFTLENKDKQSKELRCFAVELVAS